MSDVAGYDLVMTTRYTVSSPLLAPPGCEPAAAIRAITARPHGEYTDQDIHKIVVTYWRLAVEVGLDPVIAVAQLIEETDNLISWWAARPRRNPAGIGVTGDSRRLVPPLPGSAWAERDGAWYEGVSFPSWENAAIPAHVGRLLAYALRPDQEQLNQRVLIVRALAYRSLLERYRGRAPQLKGLGGTWAEDRNYPVLVAAHANRIVKS